MELGIWFHFWGILRMKSHHWLRFWKSELVLLIQFLLTNWNQNDDPNQVSAQHWFIRSNADFFFWAWYNKLGNLYWYKASIYIPGITLRAQTDIDIKVDIIASGHIQLVHSSILILIPVVLYTQVAPYGPPHSSILGLIPVLYTQVAPYGPPHSSILVLIPVLYTQVASYGPAHSSIPVLIPVLYTQVAPYVPA